MGSLDPPGYHEESKGAHLWELTAGHPYLPRFLVWTPSKGVPRASPERSVPNHRHTGHSSILCGSEHSPPLSDAVEPQIRNEHMLWNKKAATLC